MGNINANITDDNTLSKADVNLIISEINDNDSRITANTAAINNGIQPEVLDIMWLPSEIYCVQGRNTQIFFSGMTRGHAAALSFRAEPSNTTNFFWRYIINQSGNGTQTYTIKVYNSYSQIIQAKTFNIITKSIVQEPVVMKNVVFLGDSLTASGAYPLEFTRMLKGTGGTPAGLGWTNITTINEGIAGTYIDHWISSGGSLGNPFWNAGLGRNDFITYAASKGMSQIDMLYIELTGNNFLQPDNAASWIELEAKTKILIDQFHSDFPNGKVAIMPIPFLSMKGSTYFATEGLGSVQKYGITYESISKQPGYSYVKHLFTPMWFDNEYNFIIGTRPVNSRSVLTELDGGGVHPNNSGYLQMADMAFAHFIHTFCQ